MNQTSSDDMLKARWKKTKSYEQANKKLCIKIVLQIYFQQQLFIIKKSFEEMFIHE